METTNRFCAFQFLIGSLEAYAETAKKDFGMMFQFLIGSLEARLMANISPAVAFQFLIGSLEACEVLKVCREFRFQFLIGSLEARFLPS